METTPVAAFRESIDLFLDAIQSLVIQWQKNTHIDR